MFLLNSKVINGMWSVSTNITLSRLRQTILTLIQTDESEDPKGAIKTRKSKKDRQHEDQKNKYRRINIDLQNTTQKTNDPVTRTPLKTGGYLRFSWYHYIK